MKNDDIPDGNIKASSVTSSKFDAHKARLIPYSFWSAGRDVERPWIQADLGYQTYVSGVITQGDGWEGQSYDAEWITSFKVSTFAQSESDEEVFIENPDGSHMVSILLYFYTLKFQRDYSL